MTELKLGKGANLVAIRFLYKENWSITEKKAPLGEKYLHFKKDGNLVAVDNKTGEVKTAPLSDTVLTPWKKSLNNRGVFNTLDNSRTSHLNPEKKFQHLENTLENVSKTAQNGFETSKILEKIIQGGPIKKEQV